MQRLILLRHAEAENNASGGDIHRALTARGRADARRIGEALAAQGFSPALAVVSSARRAVETWEEAGPAFQGARMQLDPVLYNADPSELFGAANAADAEVVMIVAHNPGLHELVVDLLGRAGAFGQARSASFAPATAAVFDFDGRKPRFQAMLRPDDPA